MANVLVDRATMTSIADSIRGKLKTTDTYKPNQMPAAIDSIQTGSGDTTVERLEVTANGTYNAGSDKAYNPVIVNVPTGSDIEVVSKTITTNGTYTADPGQAYSPVTVNVPTKEEVKLEIAANGTYTPPSGKTYGSVVAAIPQTEVNSLSIVANGTYIPESGKAYGPVFVNVPQEGGGIDTDVLKMSADCSYLFYGDRFLSTGLGKYKNQIDWSSTSKIEYMFRDCAGDWSGWYINLTNSVYSWNMFNMTGRMKGFPHLTIAKNNSNGILAPFSNCKGANRAADLTVHNIKISTPWNGSQSARQFCQNSGLRFVPNCFYDYIKHNETNTSTYSGSVQSNPWYQTFYLARAVEEILNVPLWTKATVTSSGMLNTNQRLRRFTFETQEDGSPYECPNWTVSLQIKNNYGYGANTSGSGYGGGFSTSKYINSDSTYASLKDDPERCPQTAAYSDYGHDSALETIKSLPIVKSGTLALQGDQGSSTDQGAVNTLTEAEIAIATEKNWTVTIS